MVFYLINGLILIVFIVECFYFFVIVVVENCLIKGIKVNLILYFCLSVFLMVNLFLVVIEIVVNL